MLTPHGFPSAPGMTEIDMKIHALEQIWNIDEATASRQRRWLLRMLKFGIIIVESFTKNNLMSFASALTYSSLMAAVPAIALVFAVARGFGFGNIIEDSIHQSFTVNPELAHYLMDFVNSYLLETQNGAFIGVGLAMLLYTIVNLTTNIETAFNAIWHVDTPRNVYRRFTDYVSVFLLLPIVIIFTSGISLFLMTFRNLLPDYEFVSSTLEWMMKLGPTVLLCFTFSLLYKLMPNTPVRWSAVLVPSILVGVLFQAVQYIYLHNQIRLSSYNAVYGSFAAIPLFMIWLHISWSICLVGARMCYANQNMQEYAFDRTSQHLSRRYRDSICLLLMSRICKRFSHGGTPFTSRTLAADTQLPQSLVNLLLDELVEARLLVSFNNDKGTQQHYMPAMDIRHLSVSKVVSHLESRGSECLSRTWQLRTSEWQTLRRLRSAQSSTSDALLVDV